MKHLVIFFFISIILINNAQDLKVFHNKNDKEYIINNQDKVIIKLKNFEYFFGKIVFSSDFTNSIIQIDNTMISKNNIEYIQFSPIAKLLKTLGILAEITGLSAIGGGIFLWLSILPNPGFLVGTYVFLLSSGMIYIGAKFIRLGISLLRPHQEYGKRFTLKSNL